MRVLWKTQLILEKLMMSLPLGSEMREDLMKLISNEQAGHLENHFSPRKGCPEAWLGAD